MNPESKRPIAIEDLLRLKRAERPPVEFWAEFDRQLRAKQLAALVAKRPWWQRLPRLFTGFSRYHLSLGAAAVLAVAFITTRDNRPSVPSDLRSEPTSKVTVASASQPDLGAARALTHSGTNVPEEVKSSLGSERVASRALAAPVSGETPSLASEATAPGELSGLVPLVGVAHAQPTSDSGTLATNYGAASLANATGGEPALATSLLAANVFETRPVTRPAVEPLQQMTPPGERVRGRLLNAMVAMASSEVPVRTGERTASRLDEERLSDQVRRLGARGDRVMWKF